MVLIFGAEMVCNAASTLMSSVRDIYVRFPAPKIVRQTFGAVLPPVDVTHWMSNPKCKNNLIIADAWFFAAWKLEA